MPTPTNPLGVKGAGEAGTVGSLSAGVNAIVDALSVLGIRHIDTPCTPYRVWQAIEAAKRGQDALVSRNRHRGAIGEHHARTERDAGTGIMAAHDRRHVVAAGVEARDRRAAGRQHAAVGVGLEPDARCRACWDRPPSRRYGGVSIGPTHGFGGWLGSPLWRSKSVEPLPKSSSTPVSAARLLRATLSRRPAASTLIFVASASSVSRLDQIAARDQLAPASPPGRHAAEAVALDEGAVADQPGRNGRHRLVRAVHADDELVVGHRLIDEAPARGVDRDQAGLGAVERQMRIGAAPAREPSRFPTPASRTPASA